MTFDLITENEHLWAVRYDDCLDNVLDSILGQWNDVTWLRSFFKHNIDDLASYFKITDVNQAIYDTIEDSERLQCLIMDISPDADLDKIFRLARYLVVYSAAGVVDILRAAVEQGDAHGYRAYI